MEVIKCFVMMPFSKEFDIIWQSVKKWVEESVINLKIDVFRLDSFMRAGQIINDLMESMKSATFCIADITNYNPNVLWEVGFCEALKKPIIYLNQDLTDLPFDLKYKRMIKYNPNKLDNNLKNLIQRYVRETLNYLGLISENMIEFIINPESTKKVIAVTGSMVSDSDVKRQIISTLSLFLGKDITWLCGSFGQTDEHIIRFLVGHKEKVKVVGYNRFDLTDEISELIEQWHIPFISALDEKLPKLLAQNKKINPRDLIFLTKSDLIILFWVDHSPGTKKLIDTFMEQEKDIMIVNL